MDHEDSINWTMVILAMITGLPATFAALAAAILAVKNGWEIKAVHTMVDGQRSSMQQQIDGLRELLTESIEKGKPARAAGLAAVDVAVAATVAEAVKKANGGSKPH